MLFQIDEHQSFLSGAQINGAGGDIDVPFQAFQFLKELNEEFKKQVKAKISTVPIILFVSDDSEDYD